VLEFHLAIAQISMTQLIPIVPVSIHLAQGYIMLYSIFKKKETYSGESVNHQHTEMSPSQDHDKGLVVPSVNVIPENNNMVHKVIPQFFSEPHGIGLWVFRPVVNILWLEWLRNLLKF
jgi:hypothetical protein